MWEITQRDIERVVGVILERMIQALEEGARSSFLEVRESNLAAQEMYRRFGYEETGRRRRYYRDNDEDAILMSLEPLNRDHLILDDDAAGGKEQV